MMMNLLEIEDAVKGMSDQQLLQEAMSPSGNIPQFLIVSEKQNRDKVRKEYAQNKPQEGTVAQRIMAGDSGIMGAMPQQMAMAPQMPQRMPQMPPPQMPPQGIQQAMPPQRMAGGGIVRMANGGFLDEIVVKAPNLSDQKLEELIIDGVPTVDLIQMGFTTDDISRVGSAIDPRAIREGKKILSAAPDAIYNTLTFDPDRAQSIVERGRGAQEQAVQSAQQSFLGRTDMPRAEDPARPFRTSLQLPFDLSLQGTKFEPIADLIGSGITSVGNAYDRFMDRSDSVAERAEDKPAVLPGGIADTKQGSGSVPAEKLGLLQIDPSTNKLAGNEVLVPNDESGADKAIDEKGGYDAARVDYGDATLPFLPSTGSGADLAASNLESLMSIIEERSARNSATSRGLALANIGAGMIEGKTGQGIRDAAKVLSEDAKAQGQAQMEMAKLRTADAREGQKQALMKQDLVNKLGITDRQSAMAALKSLGDDIRILSADRAYMMTQEGKYAVGRLIEQQKLLRAMLVPDVFPKIDPQQQAPTTSPSGFSINRQA